MARPVRVADIERATGGIGRDPGRVLAEKTKPGNTLDFLDVRIQANSFGDEFIKRFMGELVRRCFVGSWSHAFRNPVREGVGRRLQAWRI